MTTNFCGKKCTVIGLGVSNLPLIDFLLKQGAKVVARDQKEIDKSDERIIGFLEKGVEFKCGADYLSDIDGDFVFRSPGIRPDIPEILAAVENGAVLSSEMELFFELCPAKIFAVTGSDGKTTTTTLTYKLLEASAKRENKGRKVYVGGNIGAPLLPLVDKMSENDYAVVELSSFQLMTMKKAAFRAAITNITPNHLNWHIDMEEYTKAKLNVYGSDTSMVVLNVDNDITSSLTGKTGAEEVLFSLESKAKICLCDGYITVDNERLLSTNDIKIPGRFNIANYMCAIALTLGFVEKEDIVCLAKSFGGVEHRNEFVCEKNGVKYYNSSIDSSPARTIAALSSYKSKPILICGGRDKHIPFDALATEILKKAKALVLTGEAKEQIFAALKNADGYTGDFTVIIENDFEKAVTSARNIAKEGDIVLLSPACTSFDAFRNFEERGKKFKSIVENF